MGLRSQTLQISVVAIRIQEIQLIVENRATSAAKRHTTFLIISLPRFALMSYEVLLPLSSAVEE